MTMRTSFCLAARPRLLRCTAALALLLAIAAVPALPQTGTVPAPGPYRIAGTLLNAVTGDPVRRAVVAVLVEADSHSVETVVSDSEGRFSLEHLPAAKYQLTASKRGFLTGFYDEHEEFNSAIVTGPDQDTEHLLFRLAPVAVLRGVVSADGGDPVQGARVMLFEQPRHPQMGQGIHQIDSAITDDTGAYEFSNLSAGEYLLAVTAEPWYAMHPTDRSTGNPAGQVRSALDVAYPVTYYDSTSDEASVTPVELAAGSREEADVSLHAVPTMHLSVPAPGRQEGRMTRASLRQTVFGVVVSAESTDFTEVHQANGIEFSGLAPGHYELTQGDPPQVVDLDLNASRQVGANSGTPVFSVAGTLRMLAGQQPPSEVQLALDRTDSAQGQREIVAAARQGRFSFSAVPPGSWSLLATEGDKVLPVVAISAGTKTQAGNRIAVIDQPLQLAVTLSRGETRIAGIARKQGKGFAGAMIVLAPRDVAAWQSLVRRDQSDSDGSFTLRDVAPGQYTVLAIENGWELDWSRPAEMARYITAGVAVTVTGDSGAKVHLDQPVAVQTR